MREVWVLYGDDGDERQRFADVERTLAQPSEPAGPDNRLRRVVRITDGDRTWYLKIFTATQWKNRLRFALTRPRARNDADREARVTAALRASGIRTPRPVACGWRGSESFYLCAELAGRPLSEWLDRPGENPAMLAAAARFCGELLRAGFWLPDLSPDHVFVEFGEGSADWSFGVLDLHNGRCAAAGPPPTRLLRRVLRRFARAARGTPAASPRALRFAVRLLRAAEIGNRRAVLAALPPLSTAERYEAAGKSADYAGRNPARAAREAGLLRRVWPGERGETVLDLPCGAARLAPWLRDRGHQVILGDAAAAMLQQGRTAHAHDRAVRADALALPLRDGAVDGVVQFRFLHHLPPEAQKRAIAEACRVARRFVVVSFFHPCSLHHLRRLLTGGPRTRFARTLDAIRGDFTRHGFTLHKSAAELPYARDLWVASFVRR